MTQTQLIEQLFALSDCTEQKKELEQNRELLDQRLVDALKEKADHFLRADIHRSQQAAELILYASSLTQNKSQRALGLLARGNALGIGAARYQEALNDYQESATLYQTQEDAIGVARVEIGQIWAHFCLGNHQAALEAGRHACEVLRAHQAWRLLMIATMNLACVSCQHGDDVIALTLLEQCLEICQRLEGEEVIAQLGWVQHNRAVSLRNLGRFDEAIQASISVRQVLLEAGQYIEAARAQQNLAMTYYVLGRYNEALENLEQAYLVFQQDGRARDAMLVELFSSDCLLYLRRFSDVLEKCQRVRALFGELGVRQVVAQAIVNEAIAYTHLARYNDALHSLHEARTIFDALDNRAWVAMTQLETAAVLQRQEQAQACLQEAQQAVQTFAELGMKVEEAQANLLCARAHLMRNDLVSADLYATEAMSVGQNKKLPSLTYLAHQIQAAIAEAEGKEAVALQHYDAAIEDVERLRGHMMIEHRADFLEDKQNLYEEAVRLCLSQGEVESGLHYAERAKSRALLEMLAYRLDLSLQAKAPGDQVLIDALKSLQDRRDQLYRRWQSNEELKLRGWKPSDGENVQQQEILQLESTITKHWHTLLIHNADYARQANLWQVRTEPIQPYLPDDTLLLEYFTINEPNNQSNNQSNNQTSIQQIIVFGISKQGIFAQRLACTLPQIQQKLKFLQVNLNRVPSSSPQQIEQSICNARGLLQELYTQLLAPVASQLAAFRQLIIVPHGILHYLPFHALHTGEHYLLESHLISYLPGASVLRYCRERPSSGVGAFLYGNSMGGKLPNTLSEVDAIAARLGEEAWKEDGLTQNALSQDALQDRMCKARLIHFATHGEFRADNPLFSGLLIGDRWLTTLDIFNLRLRASLVTLSGCQTGRSVIKGGDELAGLMRAFLSAGAASLLLSLWPVEDRSTAHWMQIFYQHLSQGAEKGAALRQAQLQLLHGQVLPSQEMGSPAMWAHPYFWAPFFLVGDWGKL